ncbi:MAG: zinc ribbon domain-containing protein [Planctomycetota bacterium]
MPTYEYETVPKSESEEPVRFEVWQRMADEPLTVHPETGEPVRRLISGGLAIRSNKGNCCDSSCKCG